MDLHLQEGTSKHPDHFEGLIVHVSKYTNPVCWSKCRANESTTKSYIVLLKIDPATWKLDTVEDSLLITQQGFKLVSFTIKFPTRIFLAFQKNLNPDPYSENGDRIQKTSDYGSGDRIRIQNTAL